MTHDEMIAVIQAHKDGKEIEFRIIAGAWRAVPAPIWDFNGCEYRVKPEPRVWWLNVYEGDTVAHVSREKAEEFSGMGRTDLVRVVESPE